MYLKSAKSTITAQKENFFFKNFLSKCEQIRSFLRICSHLLKKIENYVVSLEWVGYNFMNESNFRDVSVLETPETKGFRGL